MARKSFGLVVLALTFLAGSAFAQSTEIAGVFGRNIIRDQGISGTGLTDPNVHFGDGFTYEVNFSHRFLNFGLGGLSIEIPFIIDPHTGMHFGLGTEPKSFSAYYLTPAARFNLFPTTAFSPWVSVGGGYAHYSPSSTREFGGPSGAASTSQGVFEVGVGLDLRIYRSFKLRGQFRDLNASEPAALRAGVSGKRFGNYFAGAGIVWGF